MEGKSLDFEFSKAVLEIYLLLSTQRSGDVPHEVLDVADAAEEMAECRWQAEAQVCLLVHCVDLQAMASGDLKGGFFRLKSVN